MYEPERIKAEVYLLHKQTYLCRGYSDARECFVSRRIYVTLAMSSRKSSGVWLKMDLIPLCAIQIIIVGNNKKCVVTDKPW